MDDNEFILVAAIHLGNEYSSYGFSTKSNPDNVQTYKAWGMDTGKGVLVYIIPY